MSVILICCLLSKHLCCFIFLWCIIFRHIFNKSFLSHPFWFSHLSVSLSLSGQSCWSFCWHVSQKKCTSLHLTRTHSTLGSRSFARERTGNHMRSFILIGWGRRITVKVCSLRLSDMPCLSSPLFLTWCVRTTLSGMVSPTITWCFLTSGGR